MDPSPMVLWRVVVLVRLVRRCTVAVALNCSQEGSWVRVPASQLDFFRAPQQAIVSVMRPS